jgi:signal peptidase I
MGRVFQEKKFEAEMEVEISHQPASGTMKVGQNHVPRLRRVMRYGLGYVCLAIVTYCFFQFSHHFLVQTVQVDGVSMSPTLQNAQCYFLNRVVYLVREPKPQDIVVLRDPETNGCAVKRVVARPGDCVYVRDGQIFVNGEPLSEPYLAPGTKTYASEHYQAQLCGVDQYFVLGDNRNDSVDSRMYGAVPRANILGMVTR